MIIPALIPQTKKEFEEKIQNKEMRAFAPLWQFDILNNSMFNADSWSDPTIIGTQPDLPDFELHLMVNDPLPVIDVWLEQVKTGKRAIVHAEITKDIDQLVQDIRERGLEVGIAINPVTSLDGVENLAEKIDLLLIMGVHPGQGGQDFLGEPILHKVEEAARRFPHLVIAVDGGIKKHNAARIVKAGAQQLCIGSALWEEKDKQSLFTTLKNL